MMIKNKDISQKIATHGIFIDNKEDDHLRIKTKLKQLISDELSSMLGESERKKILIKVRFALDQDKTSNVISDTKDAEFLISPQEWHWLARHGQNKWLDYIIYRYKFKVFPGQKKLLDFPLYLLIEPTSVCNLRCIMCFQADKTFQKKEYMGMMPWSLFVNLVDQAKEAQCHAITLASRGEPILHKDFGKMLQYLAKAGILDVKINTNATRMTEQVINEILSSEVSEVVFSVDAATKKTYEEIRRGGKFEEVVKNIRLFHQIRDKYYPNSPTVTRISGVKIQDDQDRQQMSKFWSEIVDEVAIKAAIPRWDSYNNQVVNIEKPCTSLWRQMYVWYDGIVNPCDFDYKSCLAVGNAYKSSLKEIWLSDNYNKLREDHMNKNRNRHKPCDRCPLS